ncbi:MAG TPA: hypothetical protein PLV52_02210, partial [Candidatus Omnitrophota bacterium]|nr:hypothetical protein [Candidatus Omnitrophota bacterium]
MGSVMGVGWDAKTLLGFTWQKLLTQFANQALFTVLEEQIAKWGILGRIGVSFVSSIMASMVTAAFDNASISGVFSMGSLFAKLLVAITDAIWSELVNMLTGASNETQGKVKQSLSVKVATLGRAILNSFRDVFINTMIGSIKEAFSQFFQQLVSFVGFLSNVIRMNASIPEGQKKWSTSDASRAFVAAMGNLSLRSDIYRSPQGEETIWRLMLNNPDNKTAISMNPMIEIDGKSMPLLNVINIDMLMALRVTGEESLKAFALEIDNMLRAAFDTETSTSTKSYEINFFVVSLDGKKLEYVGSVIGEIGKDEKQNYRIAINPELVMPTLFKKDKGDTKEGGGGGRSPADGMLSESGATMEEAVRRLETTLLGAKTFNALMKASQNIPLTPQEEKLLAAHESLGKLVEKVQGVDIKLDLTGVDMKSPEALLSALQTAFFEYGIDLKALVAEAVSSVTGGLEPGSTQYDHIVIMLASAAMFAATTKIEGFLNSQEVKSLFTASALSSADRDRFMVEASGTVVAEAGRIFNGVISQILEGGLMPGANTDIGRQLAADVTVSLLFSMTGGMAATVGAVGSLIGEMNLQKSGAEKLINGLIENIAKEAVSTFKISIDIIRPLLEKSGFNTVQAERFVLKTASIFALGLNAVFARMMDAIIRPSLTTADVRTEAGRALVKSVTEKFIASVNMAYSSVAESIVPILRKSETALNMKAADGLVKEVFSQFANKLVDTMRAFAFLVVGFALSKLEASQKQFAQDIYGMLIKGVDAGLAMLAEKASPITNTPGREALKTELATQFKEVLRSAVYTISASFGSIIEKVTPGMWKKDIATAVENFAKGAGVDKVVAAIMEKTRGVETGAPSTGAPKTAMREFAETITGALTSKMGTAISAVVKEFTDAVQKIDVNTKEGRNEVAKLVDSTLNKLESAVIKFAPEMVQALKSDLKSTEAKATAAMVMSLVVGQIGSAYVAIAKELSPVLAKIDMANVIGGKTGQEFASSVMTKVAEGLGATFKEMMLKIMPAMEKAGMMTMEKQAVVSGVMQSAVTTLQEKFAELFVTFKPVLQVVASASADNAIGIERVGAVALSFDKIMKTELDVTFKAFAPMAEAMTRTMTTMEKAQFLGALMGPLADKAFVTVLAKTLGQVIMPIAEQAMQTMTSSEKTQYLEKAITPVLEKLNSAAVSTAMTSMTPVVESVTKSMTVSQKAYLMQTLISPISERVISMSMAVTMTTITPAVESAAKTMTYQEKSLF